MNPLDAKLSNSLEGSPSFSLRNRAFRTCWIICWTLFAAWLPPPFHRWRRFILCIFGAKIHPSARVYGSASIWYPPNLTMHANSVLGPRTDCYCMHHITIGEKAVVSQGVVLCCGTHDINDLNFQLTTHPITISAGVWVAAYAFIGPGVTLHEGAVIGARAVVFKDAEAFGVYVGNPATRIKTRFKAPTCSTIG